MYYVIYDAVSVSVYIIDEYELSINDRILAGPMSYAAAQQWIKTHRGH